MFKKKLNTSHFNHLIAEGCSVSGTINFKGSLLVDSLAEVVGIVIGENVTEEKNMSKMVVHADATIKGAKVSAFSMLVDGILAVETIWCENELVIGKNARIENSIIYHRSISIEAGARLINCQLKHLDYCSEGESL